MAALTLAGTASAQTFSASFVPAADYGASPSNSDNSVAFNAIDVAGMVGVLAPGVYKISHTVAFSHLNTGIVCQSGAFHFTASAAVYSAQALSSGCWLQWTGATGGTMVTIMPPTGSTSDGKLSGNIVKGISFDGNNGTAKSGLAIYSEMYGTFDSLYFQNLSGGIALDFNVVQATNSTFGEDCGTQFNIINNINVANNGFAYSEVGLHLGTWQTTNYVGGGTGGCNVSLNRFSNIDVAHVGMDGIILEGADNNHFWNIRTFRAGSGSSYGLRFKIYNNGSGIYYPSNSNTVIGYSSNTPAYAEGQGTVSGCAAWYVSPSGNSCTYGNSIYALDKGNASPDPTIETGADVIWRNNDGTNGGTQMNAPLGIGDNYANQISASENIGTASLRVKNTSSNHIALDDGSNVWGINLSSGNLRLNPISGSGTNVQVPALTVYASGMTSTAASAVRFGVTTVTGLNTIDPSPIAGDRAFVTDASSCNFGASVAPGSGSSKCPVWYNGSNWVAG